MLKNDMTVICVSLESAKPFSSYEGLKMNKAIFKTVRKCRFLSF